jgi:hypothetical protein
VFADLHKYLTPLQKRKEKKERIKIELTKRPRLRLKSLGQELCLERIWPFLKGSSLYRWRWDRLLMKKDF